MSHTKTFQIIAVLLFSLNFSCTQEDIGNSDLSNELDIINIENKTLLKSSSTQQSLVADQGDMYDQLIYSNYKDITNSEIEKIVDYFKKTGSSISDKNYLPIKQLYPNKRPEEYSYTKDNISYDIKIMYLNPESSDLSRKPIITMGIQFEVESDNALYENHAGGFINTSANTKEEIYFSEKTSETINNPIFVIINDTDEFVPFDDSFISVESLNVENENLSQTNQVTNPKLYIYNHKINHRYETDRYSEYNISFVHYYTNGDVRMNNDHKGWNLRDIHKNDIGKTFSWVSEDRYIFSPSTFNPISLYAGTYLLTFECDWLKGVKYVPVSGGPGGTVYHQVRMKYSNDFYQRLYVPRVYNYVQMFSSFEKGFFQARIM
jgi:hypothetical protein